MENSCPLGGLRVRLNTSDNLPGPPHSKAVSVSMCELPADGCAGGCASTRSGARAWAHVTSCGRFVAAIDARLMPRKAHAHAEGSQNRRSLRRERYRIRQCTSPDRARRRDPTGIGLTRGGSPVPEPGPRCAVPNYDHRHGESHHRVGQDGRTRRIPALSSSTSAETWSRTCRWRPTPTAGCRVPPRELNNYALAAQLRVWAERSLNEY